MDFLHSTEKASSPPSIPLKRDDKAHISLWGTIFKDEEWLQLAVDRYKVNPVLIGPDLNNPKNLVLITEDPIGDLQFTTDTFFSGLQKHTRAWNMIKFDDGIVLDIYQLITGAEDIEISDFEFLFKGNKLQATYCFWNDPERKLRTIKPPDIIGIGGVITETKNVEPVCCLRLSLPEKPIQQQVFRHVFCPKLEYILTERMYSYNDDIIEAFELRG